MARLREGKSCMRDKEGRLPCAALPDTHIQYGSTHPHTHCTLHTYMVWDDTCTLCTHYTHTPYNTLVKLFVTNTQSRWTFAKVPPARFGESQLNLKFIEYSE